MTYEHKKPDKEENMPFADQLWYFKRNKCPECGDKQEPLGTKAWPYCKKHAVIEDRKPKR